MESKKPRKADGSIPTEPMRSSPPKRQKTSGIDPTLSVEARCRQRLSLESPEQQFARMNRDLTLGEQVIRNPLIRDKILSHFNPFNRNDLQRVMELRCFYKLLPDIDLIECYFGKAWGFQKGEFALGNGRAERSVEATKWVVRLAHPEVKGARIYPPSKPDIEEMDTREEIIGAYRELTVVPEEVYKTAVAAGHVLRDMAAASRVVLPSAQAQAEDEGKGHGNEKANERANELPKYKEKEKEKEKEKVARGGVCRTPEYFDLVCGSGLDAPTIRWLAGTYNSLFPDKAVGAAAMGGANHVIDLLVDEFGVEVDQNMLCMTLAVKHSQHATIDHLVTKHGVDPDQVRYWNAWTPLMYAADYGRVETIKHLVEVHSVNVHARNVYGKTAFDVAKAERHKECAQVLLQYMIDRSPFFLGQRSRGEETG